MNQAIELSLQDELSLDQFDEKPLEERLRRGDAFVARTIGQFEVLITLKAGGSSCI